jgi:hypothetical protein
VAWWDGEFESPSLQRRVGEPSVPQCGAIVFPPIAWSGVGALFALGLAAMPVVQNPFIYFQF